MLTKVGETLVVFFPIKGAPELAPVGCLGVAGLCAVKIGNHKLNQLFRVQTPVCSKIQRVCGSSDFPLFSPLASLLSLLSALRGVIRVHSIYYYLVMNPAQSRCAMVTLLQNRIAAPMAYHQHCSAKSISRKLPPTVALSARSQAQKLWSRRQRLPSVCSMATYPT